MADSDDSATARLGFWDAVSLIVGIVVGVSIFKSPSTIFSNVPDPWTGLGLWLFGGVLSIAGALCYAELATTYPRSGGDYVYLTRAYGAWAGFLFGWAQLAVIMTGSIAALAYVFGDYGVRLLRLAPDAAVWFAVAVVGLLTVMNLFGVRLGKIVQNVLTAAKVLGLGGILAAGLLAGTQEPPSTAETGVQGGSFGLAMIFVLYAYGGWNDSVFVAAEVRNRNRNMPWALFLGMAGVTLLYLLINVAYLRGLGFTGVRSSRAPAADVLDAALGDWGGRGMSLLVMISALGAVNGLIFTGSRVYASMGADHRVFALLGRWHPRLQSPVWALAAQTAVASALIVVVGTERGRAVVDRCMQSVDLAPLRWERYGGGFETIVTAAAPIFWLFFLSTGIALTVLRITDAPTPRPFRVPLYPATNLLFCAMCGYMLYAAVDYARWLSLLAIVPLLLGVPLYVVGGGKRRE